MFLTLTNCLSCQSRIAISLAIYRGHLGLSAQSPKKVSKRVPGASRPRGSKKSENNRKSTIFQVFFQVFNPVFDFFLTFSAPPPPPERPGNPFRDFFRTSGRKAQMTPVNGQLSCQSRILRPSFCWLCQFLMDELELMLRILPLNNGTLRVFLSNAWRGHPCRASR